MPDTQGRGSNVTRASNLSAPIPPTELDLAEGVGELAVAGRVCMARFRVERRGVI